MGEAVGPRADRRRTRPRRHVNFEAGNRVELLCGGSEFFPALIEAIEAAQRRGLPRDLHLSRRRDRAPRHRRARRGREARRAGARDGRRFRLGEPRADDPREVRRRRASSTSCSGPRTIRGAAASRGSRASACAACIASWRWSIARSRSAAASTCSTTSTIRTTGALEAPRFDFAAKVEGPIVGPISALHAQPVAAPDLATRWRRRNGARARPSRPGSRGANGRGAARAAATSASRS